MERVIKTDRLVLRPITLEDAPAFSKLAGDFDIAKMTGSIPSPFPVLSAEVRTMMFEAAWRQHTEYSYAISIDGGALMGELSLFKRKGESGFELGYWLGRPYWGHGYMTEACQALIETAENSLGLTHIKAGVFEDNPGSIRILEKLGFEGLGPEADYFSIARLCKAKSLGFIRRKSTAPLHAGPHAAIESA